MSRFSYGYRVRALLALSTAAFAALPAAFAQSSGAAVSVPGYGPGIAVHVDVGPNTPTCRPGVPCSIPYSNALVDIFDTQRQPVATLTTNDRGNFITSLPAGDYIVHVMVVDFPRCPEATVTVGARQFTLAEIHCDNSLR